jgi:hypothetical protein
MEWEEATDQLHDVVSRMSRAKLCLPPSASGLYTRRFLLRARPFLLSPGSRGVTTLHFKTMVKIRNQPIIFTPKKFSTEIIH